MLLVAAAVLVALTWRADVGDSEGSPVLSGHCSVSGSSVTVTTEQAAHAATIAAVARSRGLPERAVALALATAQQESRLRNLDYGDRDSLGLFQQRPSQGWGTEAEVQDPGYAAGQFFDRLVRVPGWAEGRLTVVAQAVQRSGFPEAYQQWEPMATDLAAALSSTEPARLTCRYEARSPSAPLPERLTAVAQAAGAELGVPAAPDPSGGVSVDGAAGWPGATWAVAHAERLQIAAVDVAGWRWTSEDGWVQTPASAPTGIRLRLVG